MTAQKPLIPLRALTSLLVMTYLTGCGGGFEVAKPDPNQIIAIQNSEPSIAKATRPPADSQPLPLPTIPRSELLTDTSSPIAGKQIEPRATGSGSTTPFQNGVVSLADVSSAPFNTAAKLVFRVGQNNYACTAEFVGDSGDVIMTAGHCVYDNLANTWGSNFTLYVDYDSGTSQVILDWQCAAIYSGWPQRRWDRDYAFIKVRGSFARSLGIKLNLPDQWTAFGYPINYYSGQRLVKVDGSRGSSGSVIQMRDNPLGHGASGGAWIVGQYAVGLNSFKYDNDPNSMYGPRFDGLTSQLYEFTRSGCTSDKIPLGTNPKVASYNPMKSYIESDPVEVTAQVELQRVPTKDCPCNGSLETFINNSSKSDYDVEVGYTAFAGDQSELVGSNNLSGRVASNEKMSMGCTRGDKSGKLCQIETEFILKRARRIVSINAGNRRQVTSSFCSEQCVNNPSGGFCLPTQGSLGSALAPLAGFVADTVDPNKPDGVVTTKRELVTRLKGDPDQADPCARGDFVKSSADLTNSGVHCRTTSPTVTGQPGEPRLSLRSPPRATASIQQSANAAFEKRQESPVLELFGDNASDLNALYGGHVVNVARAGTLLVVTTENGCVSGPAK